MLSHPPAFKIVWRVFVREQVREELPAWFEKRIDLRQKQSVVFHVFKEFDGQDAVEGAC